MNFEDESEWTQLSTEEKKTTLPEAGRDTEWFS